MQVKERFMVYQRDFIQFKGVNNLNSFLGEVNQTKNKKYNYNGFLSNKMLVANAVKTGVPINLFLEIAESTPFSDAQWSNFLEINIRTLQRYKQTDNFVFKKLQSEKIFELAEVVNFGYQVFDAPEKFEIWLNMPSVALSNLNPIELFDNSFGIDLVMAELINIEHGIFVL